MMNWHDLKNVKVTIMGLGLNGGGLASAKFFVQRGAIVTVTDKKNETELAATLEQLKGLPIRFVLGRHDEADFLGADLVIKNPAVRAGNPYLALAKRVETDLSVFLSTIQNPVFAITGSKGKSTTSMALHHILKTVDSRSLIGGNITISPLTFLDSIPADAPLVLELSSWQLADLKGRSLLKPQLAGVTNILWDHMNTYTDQTAYAADKAVVFESQQSHQWSLINADQSWASWFAQRTHAQIALVSAGSEPQLAGFEERVHARFCLEASGGKWIDANGQWQEASFLPSQLAVPGQAFRLNCLAAGAYAVLWGIDPAVVYQALTTFSGVEHRLERFQTWRGIDFFNDTTATIPEAAVASAESFDRPVHWITGGADKSLDMKALESMKKAPASLSVLKGSATNRMLPIFDQKGWPYQGPFENLQLAVEAALARAHSGDVILFSPGATSFEMFDNEFDRGHTFKRIVRNLCTEGL